MSEDTRYKHTLFKCDRYACNFICYTLNQLQEHMLDKHSSTFIPKYTVNGFHKEMKNDSTRDM